MVMCILLVHVNRKIYRRFNNSGGSEDLMLYNTFDQQQEDFIAYLHVSFINKTIGKTLNRSMCLFLFNLD